MFGVGVAGVLGVAGCSFNAPDAGKTVSRIRVVPILNDPPRGAVLLGRAEYLGSSDPGTAKDAGVTTVFAAPGSPSTILDYYRRAYPQLEFRRESGTADAISINGTDGWAYVLVNIRAKAPYLPVLRPRVEAGAAGFNICDSAHQRANRPQCLPR